MIKTDVRGIMGLKSAFRKAAVAQQFYPGLVSFFTSPYFIVRFHLVASVRKHAERFKGQIIDFGCGSKPYERLFSGVERYVGVDVEVSGHDHRTSKVDHFYKGSVLPFDGETFDGAVSFEVFEHVENLSEMVQEIFRVLKPGSEFLVTTPFIFPEHEVPYDFRRHTRYGIRSLLEKSGFEVVEIAETTGTILTIAQCINHYLFRDLSYDNTVAKAIVHLLFSLPTTIIAYALSKVLPNGGDFYLNLVVIARKPK